MGSTTRATTGDHFGEPSSGHRYVEFGCGLGSVTRWATSVGADALGIDLSADQIAESELAEGKTEFRGGSVYDHGLPPESFDVSYSRWLLMHLNRLIDAMRTIYAALKPGGVMACEEAGMSAIYAEPPSGYHEYVEIAFAVGATVAWTTRAVAVGWSVIPRGGRERPPDVPEP